MLNGYYYEPAIPLLEDIPKRNGNICPPKNLCTNAYIIRNSQKVEITQIYISWWKDKQNVVNTYKMDGYWQ